MYSINLTHTNFTKKVIKILNITNIITFHFLIIETNSV